MTLEQFTVLTKLMRGNPESAANRAARLVLVDRTPKAEAARETGATPSTVNDAVRRYRDAHNNVRRAYGLLADESAAQLQ